MVIILDSIRSIHNVGSIFRTADAAGVKKIYLCGVTPMPTDRFGKVRPQFQKVALGAQHSVEWEYFDSIVPCMQALKKQDYTIVAVEQHRKAIPYYQFRPKTYSLQRIALIFGNEVRGMSPAVLKKADAILEIPMRGKMVRQAHHPKNHPEQSRGKESLNVSVAVGIVLFGIQY